MTNRAKEAILQAALAAKDRCQKAADTLTDSVSLEAYRHLVREDKGRQIWTEALQRALREHEIVVIPSSEEIYWLDNTVIIPSDRHIEATGAVIRLVPEYPRIMLRNEHTHDGTAMPIPAGDRDRNISIHGGSWEESSTSRGLRGYDGEHEDFHGVQTCMLFNNLDLLSITDVTFAHTTSFSLQVGDLTDGVFENLFFVSCYADGLHINGNSENLYIRNFRGHVGDDLVALNMYDWLGSSINYGPAKNIFCEEIHSAPDSTAKAMRLQPGIFQYRDGRKVDCSLQDIYIRHVSGIYEYKLYYQTPPYRLGETPEGCGAGSADNLFFEDIHIRAQRPGYPLDVPETGHYGMFFLNSNIGHLSLQDIFYEVGPDESPRTHLVAVGPMTWRGKDYEVFDPYISGTVDTLEMENIVVNGVRGTDAEKLVKVISFDDVNGDGFSSGRGEITHLILK